ncbi:MAG TPA: sensor histidine kinase [Casimicrobiaceae bacterium]|nr:sensor histidine kinase [Casimicrobiaceae bacterium]
MAIDDEKPKGDSTYRDLAVVAAITLSFALLSAYFDLGESVGRWTRPVERYQVDELPGVLMVLGLGLAWFAWRRAVAARDELRRRLAIQVDLSVALREKSRLEGINLQLQEQERRKLARELHDELGQNLNAIKIEAVSIRGGDWACPAAVQEAAISIVRMVDSLQATVRDMVRQLRPPGLDELGLAAALEECVDGWRRRLPSTQFDLAVPTTGADWGDALNMAVYRVVQESLTNVARHANARRVAVSLSCEEAAGNPGRAVVLQIRDDGVGVTRPQSRGGLGLYGMRERVESLGGTFQVISPTPGGFLVLARLPLEPLAA